MASPAFDPISPQSSIVLPETGNPSLVLAKLPFKVYSSDDFLTGAAEQVTYTYRKLAGDVMDIELVAGQVYSAYEEACLEYSYLVNLHQGKNVLSSLLGSPTGTFDEHGTLVTGTNTALNYPRFQFNYANRVMAGYGDKVAVGGDLTIYSASIDIVDDQQDYDLQALISANPVFSGSVGTHKVDIRRVYYKTPRAVWRFYGYYGGINTVGNLSTYGQFADDSNFEVIPAWQNKLQAMAYKDSIYTRLSHYSYEIRNNKLRLYPVPYNLTGVFKIWVQFTIPQSATDSDTDGVSGVNNLNTLPFDNLPYENINSMGKNWIRRFALALSKEMLGHARRKLATIPIPGSEVTLDGPALITEAIAEQEKLREELKVVLEDLTYTKLAEKDSSIAENVNKIAQYAPLSIFTG